MHAHYSWRSYHFDWKTPRRSLHTPIRHLRTTTEACGGREGNVRANVRPIMVLAQDLSGFVDLFFGSGCTLPRRPRRSSRIIGRRYLAPPIRCVVEVVRGSDPRHELGFAASVGGGFDPAAIWVSHNTLGGVISSATRDTSSMLGRGLISRYYRTSPCSFMTLTPSLPCQACRTRLSTRLRT